VFSIAFSKLYFIVAAYTTLLLLPRILGSPEAFGLFAATISVVSILNNVMIQATIQTVSKRVSEDLTHAPVSLRQGLLFQTTVGGVIAGSMFFAAPLFAERVLLDPEMSALLRIASIVVFSYALYAALIGSLNGRQLFQKQAALDMTFTTLRTTGILGAAALGFGVLGAISGFASASVALLAVSLVVVGVGQPPGRVPWKRWVVFTAPLWLYHLSLNLTLQVDLMVLKRTVAVLAMEADEVREAAALTASRFAGFYRAAQTFAFVPYQLIISVAFVVFPMVSSSVSAGDLETTRRYIRGALRFSLLLLLSIATPIAGAASGVMRIAYPESYLAGSGALAVLSLGTVCFALFVIGATVLSGAGHPAFAAAIGSTAVAIVVASNLTLLRLVGIGDQTLLAAACGTSIGMGFAFLAVGTSLYRRFGAFIPPATALRAVIAGGVGFAVAHAVPSHTRLLAIAALVAGGLAYVAALFVLREIRAADIDEIRRVVSRPKS
jgi:stage V sporulation protein B